jgi:fermentation-respiration switch protein FrsA (DUF1100 family)
MLWVLAVLFACLIGLTVLVRLIEPRLAFFPSAGEADTPRTFGIDFDPLTLPTADGERLRAWRMPVVGARAHIVYFHGNGGNLSVWAPILAGIVRRGYSVLAIDYRGYGMSTGHPTERGLYKDVDATVEQVRLDTDRAIPVIYWGRSLGATMAAYAATVRNPDGLILESGFPDVWAVVRSAPLLVPLAAFSSYRFPTAEYVNHAGTPALVMHGDHDTVIPYALGRALFDRIAGPKEFVTLRGADHNDALPPEPTVYWNVVATFIASRRR